MAAEDWRLILGKMAACWLRSAGSQEDLSCVDLAAGCDVISFSVILEDKKF